MMDFLVNAWWVIMIIGIVGSFIFVCPLPILLLGAIFGVLYYINPKL